ncbi:SIS domain-containing protein [Blastococcus sp. PRF04-17]|uniref:SIS domain-containing protein n=1 Tax=Blastococcus sp. PRF04-17 TaxID=2933797 RepID=UPI001FF569E9|nr:SIS domain-containing protein [Blastococcus sp. PRF04-17]UOY02856.1 SIS domain-containing protein [Blastococcus sp. PRF04-17]
MTAPGELMRREIAEQPDRWLDLVADRRAVDAAAEFLRDRLAAGRLSGLVFAARGTSDHAAVYAQYLAQALLGLPAAMATPSVATVYGRNVHDPNSCLVAVSQSGASPDLIATLESARARGGPTIAFTNDPGSPLALAADVHVPLLAGPERSVAATKSYTAELIALHMWLRAVAGDPAGRVDADIRALAEHGRTVIRRSAGLAPDLAERLADADRALLIGRAFGAATAREGALKLMETSSIAASGWSAADAKHGPLAAVTTGTPVFCFVGERTGRASVEALLPDLYGRGADVHLIGNDPEGSGLAGILPPDVADELLPVLSIVPVQSLALELALRKGLDPDRPLGLTKVTRTT